ncbi:MAG TPA: TonB-dependent receptor [Candidatus Limnocylindrales bacterium]|nr:TonB-dependent receptor [Candidatus Limnocylindrales bacterium]
MQRRQSLFAFVLVCVLFVLGVGSTFAQVNTATLSGVVTDQQGLTLRGAKITVTSAVTGAERRAVADESGHYTIVGLVPGEYKLRVEGGSNFAPYEIPSLDLRVGSESIVNVTLSLGTQTQTVTVTTESAVVETTRTESAQTVEERQIDNLPINGRNYINFTEINSQTTRDMSPTIGPAPNSGLNISGARARGNMVSVDGADAVDNSVNAIRSTVSQEAVQEFQMILSNYNAEYGRASGGVVNIVTKSGGNGFHGDIYGYLRNKAFQSRNPFSGQVDANGDLVPIKQAYTRTQSGLTFGGPLKKDKTFYFFSYEYTQREETGFSSIGQGNFGMQTVNLPLGPGTVLPVQLTSDQASAVNALLTSGDPTGTLQALGVNYGVLLGSASSVATNKIDFGLVAAGATGGLVNPGPGAQFPIPVTCPVGATVGTVTCSSFPVGPNFSYGVAALPASYVGLNSIRGNFPAMEKTSLWSARLDQRWNNHNSSFIRVGVSPSEVTGIPSTSQNQVFGQNAGTRVGESHYRDLNVTFQHDTILSDTTFNEFRFQAARRGLHFGYSPLPGGSDIGVNIPGYAYFGREPYSTVDRIERRFQFSDAGTLTRGRHTFKVGVDYNLVQLRSAKQQIFELDFGGDVNFGGISANSLGFPASVPTPGGALVLPGATPLQAYGLGIPSTYIQGIGSSNQPFDNIPLAFFAQDSWRATSKLTLNYGVRYDVELTPLFAPATAINAAAEQSLGVIEGIPRDYNNVAPRFGLAWDPAGNGKTVIRAGYGLFYDHPLLAIAFDAVTADGGRSVQLISAGTTPSACGLVTPACGSGLDTPTNLNGSSIFQGVLNALPSMFYLPNQQRFDPYPSNSLFASQNYLAAGFPLPILPFTLPVSKNFQFGYAQQANLTLERVLGGTWKLSAGYQWTRGIHLNRPIDVNSTDPVLLTKNFANAVASGIPTPGNSPLGFAVPSGTANSCVTTGANTSVFLIAPSALGLGFAGSPTCGGAPIGYIGTPAFFNYFRKSGPNPSFAGLVPGGYATQVALANAAGFPAGFGVPVPFNSVDAQVSDAASSYNALTVNLEKRFSKHFQMLSSYTWSHSIDNGTDLQSTLEPADSRFPQLEKGNSVNDQRHRWVTSGVFQTAPHTHGQSFGSSFFSNFTVAPLIEVSSGRPFNVILGEDTRLDLGASQIRPDLGGGTTSKYIPGVSFGLPTQCWMNGAPGQTFTIPGVTPPLGCTGTLGRDKFTMPKFFQFDMRISKGINLGERLRLDLIADGFNLTNHTNISAVNQLCDPFAGSTCTAGQPTAAYDARQFQFAIKLNW